MSADQTQHQSPDDLKDAKDLSLKRTRPPSEVPGYQISKLLGAGAFGEVWLAIDRKTGRRVALKFYTRKSSLDVTLLSREVEKLVFLAADRYVVQLLDVGWDADPPYYVMDYIENGSLEDELKRVNSMSVENAVELFQEIAVGLMHLHGKGILHCDLKPGNVLLDQDHKPRLADFGQSRLTHEMAPALGTLFFMAPEQADLKAAPDAKWDVYALGALLYAMITGNPPYRDEQLVETIESSVDIEHRLEMYRKAIDASPKPNGHRKKKNVDRGLTEIIDRCIAPDPKHRFSSVQSVLLALSKREQGIARRPLITLGILAPLVLLSLAIFFGYTVYNSAIDQTRTQLEQKEKVNNGWAARLAANNAGIQIDKYFLAVDRLAADPDVEKGVKAVLADSDLMNQLQSLSDPEKNENSQLDQARSDFYGNPIRQKLQAPLKRRLDSEEFALSASWFICDRSGTQIAAEFRKKPAKTNTDGSVGRAIVITIGRNYSYRSYFTGEEKDALDKDDPSRKYDVDLAPDKRKRIDEPFLSAVFKSTATNTWKIAFTKPLVIDGKFEGIVGVTVELGKFVEFDNLGGHVMLVDERDGEYKGIVLEHPLIYETMMDPLLDKVPDELSDVRADVNQLKDDAQNKKVTIIPDPMRDTSQAKKLGKYDGNWIAAKADVWMRNSQSAGSSNEPEMKKIPTGLVVIAMKDYEPILEPVLELGRSLMRSGLTALSLFLILGLAFAIWVRRTMRKATLRIARMYASNTESAAIEEMESVLGISPVQESRFE